MTTAEEIFKEAWHKADHEGKTGERVAAGLDALRAAGLLVSAPIEKQTETPCSACGTDYKACTELVLGQERRACCSSCAHSDTHNAPLAAVSPQETSELRGQAFFKEDK